ncbi:hypothetical protein [Holdemania massiliensis]
MKGLRNFLLAALILSVVSGCSQKAEPVAPGEAAVIQGKLEDGTTYEASVKLTGYLNQDQLQQLRDYDLYIEDALGAVEMEVTLNQLEGRDVLDLTESWEASYPAETAEEESEHEFLVTYPGSWFHGIKPLKVNESCRGWALITRESDPALMKLYYVDHKEESKEVVFQMPQPADDVMPESGSLKVGEPLYAGNMELTVEEIKTARDILMYRSDSGYSWDVGDSVIQLRVRIKNQEDYDLSITSITMIYDMGTEYWVSDFIAQESAKEFVIEPSSPAKTERVWRLGIVANLNTKNRARLKLMVNGFCFGVDYALGEDWDTYSICQTGDVIETPQDRMTIEQIRVATHLNPLNTTGDYTYLKADPGTQFYIIEGTYENLSSETVLAEERLGILWQESSEFVYGWVLIPEGNDFLQSKTLQPQTQTKVCLVIMLTEEQMQRLDRIRIGVGDEVVKGSAA